MLNKPKLSASETVSYTADATERDLLDAVSRLYGDNTPPTGYTAVLMQDSPGVVLSHPPTRRVMDVRNRSNSIKLPPEQTKQHFRFLPQQEHLDGAFLARRILQMGGRVQKETGEVSITTYPWVIARIQAFVRGMGVSAAERTNPVVPGAVIQNGDPENAEHAILPEQYLAPSAQRQILRIRFWGACGADEKALRRMQECGFAVSAVSRLPDVHQIGTSELIVVQEETSAADFRNAPAEICSNVVGVVDVDPISDTSGMFRYVRGSVTDKSDAISFALDHGLGIRRNIGSDGYIVSGSLPLPAALNAAGKLIHAERGVTAAQMNGVLPAGLAKTPTWKNPLEDFPPEVYEEYRRLMRDDIRSLVQELRALQT